MDMFPPQAPPAETSHANQAAHAAIERMGDLQRWIVEQQKALPDLPSRIDDGDAFLAGLDAFWESSVRDAPGAHAIPLRQAFARRLAQAASDDAMLRNNDGTLSGEAMALVRAVALGAPGTPLPDHLHAWELMVGDVPYAGALVLQDDRHGGSVLLFTAEGGWQAFESLQALYRDVEWGMRAQLSQLGELPGSDVDDMDKVIDTHFLDTRTIGGDVFDTLMRRLADRVRERAVAAIDLAITDDELQDRLHDALALDRVLDVHAIVRQRDFALAARLEEERLAPLPATVRRDWQRAAAGYRDSWRLARMDATPPSLEAYSEDLLAAGLRRHGIDAEPRDLYVRLTRRVPDKPLANALSGFPYEDLSLVELAFRNVATAGIDELRVVRADGTPRSDVSTETLRDIVRGLDLSNRYASHLDAMFGDSAEGRERRAAITAMQRAAMRFDAQEARLASYYAFEDPARHALATAGAPLVYHREERGFAWVDAVLDHPHPDGRRRVGGHEIVVRQLTYQGAPLSGVFMIGARQRRAVPNLVLYTPDAPDGMAFREFRDRDELDRHFLLDRRFENYLLDRLPAAFAEAGPDGRRRFRTARLNGDRSLDWILGTEACQGCSEPAARFEEREVTASFLDVAYDDTLALAMENVRQLARSTGETDRQAWHDAFRWTQVPSLLFTEFVAGSVASAPRAVQASWRFYDKVKAGESAEAFLAFVDGYTAALNVLPLYTQVPRLAGASVRASAGSRTLVPTRRALPEPGTLFDDRYLARHVAPPAGDVPASGVHAIGGQHYIHQNGKMYHAKYDADLSGWRLGRPGAPDAHFTGPAIERLADGRWHFRQVGLRGGGNLPGRHAYRSMPERPLDMMSDNELLNPDVAALTPHQREAITTKLRDLLSPRKYERTLKHMLGREPAAQRLSDAERQAWQEALNKGRSTPRDATIATLPPIPAGSDPAAFASRVPSIPRQEWPQYVYAYLPRPVAQHGTEVVSLSLQPLLVSRTQYIRGVPVTTLPPDTPLSSLPPALAPWLPRPTATSGGTLGSATGGWVRINLHALPVETGRLPHGIWRPAVRADLSIEPNFIAPASPFRLHKLNEHGYVLHGGQAPRSRGLARFFDDEFEIGSP